jgi:hypothetical protein
MCENLLKYRQCRIKTAKICPNPFHNFLAKISNVKIEAPLETVSRNKNKELLHKIGDLHHGSESCKESHTHTDSGFARRFSFLPGPFVTSWREKITERIERRWS